MNNMIINYQTATIAILRDMRWLRLMYYLLTFFLGMTLGLTKTSQSLITAITTNHQLTHQILWCCWSIIFAGLSSIIFNNIADQEIDKICNKQRPLIQGKITYKNYLRLAWIAACISLLCAILVNIVAFCAIFVVILLYYCYSMPPIRYKRITVLSKIVISGNSLILLGLGYFLIAHNLQDLPLSLIPFILISGTVAANYIDLKDITGDQANNIKTMPIILGVPTASKIIGIGFIITYLGFSVLFNNYTYYLIFITSGLIMFYLITKPNYQDNIVTIWQLINLIALIVLLIKLVN